jgi:hypothetical protein
MKKLEKMDGKLFQSLKLNEMSNLDNLNGGIDWVGAVVSAIIGAAVDAVIKDPVGTVVKGGDPINGHYIDPIKRPLNPEPVTETVGIVLQSGI